MDTPLRSTGIPGLDHPLGGGLAASRPYLDQGDPCVGKTTPGLRILLEGVRRGESCPYTSSESHPEVEAVNRSRGWSLRGIDCAGGTTR